MALRGGSGSLVADSDILCIIDVDKEDGVIPGVEHSLIIRT